MKTTMTIDTNLRIAVVDDDAICRTFMTEVLAEAGCEVAPCASALEFLRLSGRERFSALILDLAMPDVDAFELVERLAVMPEPQTIVIVSSMQQPVIDAAVAVFRNSGMRIIGAFRKPLVSGAIQMLLQALHQSEPPSGIPN